jgi:hypothetical protein
MIWPYGFGWNLDTNEPHSMGLKEKPFGQTWQHEKAFWSHDGLGPIWLNFDTWMNLSTWVVPKDIDECEKQMKLTTLLTLITYKVCDYVNLTFGMYKNIQ